MGWGGLHCWRLGTWEAKLPTGQGGAGFTHSRSTPAHPLGGRSGDFDYGCKVRACDAAGFESFSLAQS